MKVGDLVYVPYFEEYGIIVEIYCHGEDGVNVCWHVAYPCGYYSNEYETDMEVVSTGQKMTYPPTPEHDTLPS